MHAIARKPEVRPILGVARRQPQGHTLDARGGEMKTCWKKWKRAGYGRASQNTKRDQSRQSCLRRLSRFRWKYSRCQIGEGQSSLLERTGHRTNLCNAGEPCNEPFAEWMHRVQDQRIE